MAAPVHVDKVALRHGELLKEFEAFGANGCTAAALMQQIARQLHAKISHYNWIGFLLVDPTCPGVLVLKVHSGSFQTPHVRIPFAVGLCGAAAACEKTIVVDDLDADPRVLKDSDLARSEIVVPIFSHQRLIGEIDINSYFRAAFDAPGQAFVEACARIVGMHYEIQV